MTDARGQEELVEVELPAATLLEDVLGYDALTPDQADGLRDGPTEPVLRGRLLAALLRINPWLDAETAGRAVGAVTRIIAVDLTEANEKAHTLLTFGIPLSMTDAQGRRVDRTAHFLDFDQPKSNQFDYVRQLRIRGPSGDIVPDIVIYVNGLPLAVIECKAPSLAEPVDEGIRQFRRYQGAGEFAGQGAPRLFETTQICIVAARGDAAYGTVGTPGRHWAQWKTAHPLTATELERRLGRGLTAQDTTLAGLLDKGNLLDLLRNFIVFESENGRRIKKLARYQQFLAVQKTLDHIAAARIPSGRGGVIHHTQGSGKSLTMVFLATKLRRWREAENPTLVIVTDRIDLDRQIASTFQRAGFPNPVQANSGQQLRQLLSGGAGTTVLTTVHKFQTAVPTENAVISRDSNLFVMVDEAHRTQYGAMAARMRAGLPNACMIAFTGTPIDKEDRSTRKTFGDYIHRYRIEEAVHDGATVPILYDMRDVRLRVDGKDLERELRRNYPELSDAEIEGLKRKAPLSELVATHPKRIEEVCRDLIAHYRTQIEPNGFKAQIVTTSRHAAVQYKEMLERLNGPESAVIMSSVHGDPTELRVHHMTDRQRDTTIEQFKDPTSPLKIIIVCDMLLTGFDAPVEQVMYLDAPLRDHTLLQAIARVNRTAEGTAGPKTHGLVVDYWGDAKRIADALKIFDEEDQSPMKSRQDKINDMKNRHRAAMRFFDGIDRKDDEACIVLLEPEEVRAAFDIAFRRFAQAMDILLPDPGALETPYLSDLKWLGRIRAQARRRYRDERLTFRNYGAKAEELIRQYLETDGVEQLLEPVSILAPEFQAQMQRLGSDEARAAEMEHALRHEIHVHRDQNPVLFESLWLRLQKLIDDRRQARISAAAALDRLQPIADDVRAARRDEPENPSALSGTPGAILGLIAGSLGDGPAKGVKAATDIAAALDDLAVIDWHHKEDVKRQMRRAIKTELRAAGVGQDQLEALTARIMDVARARLVR